MASSAVTVTETIREMPEEKYANFIKIVMLLVQTGCFVLRNVMETFVRNINKTQSTMTFESFLNRESVRCTLFHLGMKKLCCVCNKRNFDKQISEFKWKALYNISKSREITCGKNHIKGLESHCCLYMACQDVLNRLDISLMCFLILNISDFDKSKNFIEMIKELREIRNNTFAHAASTSMSNAQFENIWYDSCKIFKELARFTRDPNVIRVVPSQITEIEQLTLGHADAFSESVEILQQSFQIMQKTQRIKTTLERGHLDDITTFDGVPNGCSSLLEVSVKIDNKIKKLQRMKQEICKEMKKDPREINQMQFSGNIRHRGGEITLMVLGRSGSRKSTIANYIAGKEYFKCPLALHCMTNEVNQLRMRRQGRVVTIIDTPDLFDEQTKTTIEQEKNANHNVFYLCAVPIGMKAYCDKHVVDVLKQYSVFDKSIVVFTDMIIKDKNTIESMIRNLPRSSSLGEMLENCQNRYIILEQNCHQEIPGNIQTVFEMIADMESTDSQEQNIDQNEMKGTRDKSLSGNLENIFRRLEIPSFLPDLQEDIGSVEDIPEDRMQFFQEKVLAMLQEKQQLEDELKSIETSVIETAHSALPAVTNSVFTEMKVFLREREEERTDILEEKHRLTQKITELYLEQNLAKANEMLRDEKEEENISMLKDKVKDLEQKLDDMNFKIEHSSQTPHDVGNGNGYDYSFDADEDGQHEFHERSNDDADYDIANTNYNTDEDKDEYQRNVDDNNHDYGGVDNEQSDEELMQKQMTEKSACQQIFEKSEVQNILLQMSDSTTSQRVTIVENSSVKPYDLHGGNNNDDSVNANVDDGYNELQERSIDETNYDIANNNNNNNTDEERDEYRRKVDDNDYGGVDNEPSNGVLMQKQRTSKLERSTVAQPVNLTVSHVAVMTFGLRHTGYAFSAYSGNEIVTSIWTEGKKIRLKAPTSILLTKDKQFQSFGYEAENSYRQLKQEGLHSEFLFFHRFSDWLKECKTPTRYSMIEDENKITVEARIVFSLAIEYLKDRLFHELAKSVYCELPISKIHFVLVVPEKPGDSLTQFLKEAADAAGITAQQLTILDKSRAAWIYYVRRYKLPYIFSEAKLEAKYLMLHQGAYSTELHLIIRGRGNVSSEIVHVIKYPCGWKSMDNAFINFLREIVGDEVVDKLKENYPGDYKSLIRAFALKKLYHSMDICSAIMDVPSSLLSLTEDILEITLSQAVQTSKYRDNVEVVDESLRILTYTYMEFFNQASAAVVHCLDVVYKDSENDLVKEIIMSGDFSCNDIVIKAIEKRYPGKIVRSDFDNPHIVVLKGAMRYGQLFVADKTGAK